MTVLMIVINVFIKKDVLTWRLMLHESSMAAVDLKYSLVIARL